MISRYEIKFRVNHRQKTRFMQAARFGLVADPHGKNACYRVSSVYFDSRELDFYWEKVDGIDVRKKLRLRFYGDVESKADLRERPCFLELKHRVKDSVLKERLRLVPDGACRILEDPGNLRDIRQCVVDEDRSQRSTLACIELLEASMDLEPANLITYYREAWIGRVDGRLRVTFDQLAHVLRPDCYGRINSRAGLPIIPPGHYIMEVKFNESFPRWIRDIVADQHLLPQRFSKYAAGIETLRRVDARCRSNLWALESGIGTPVGDATAPEEATRVDGPPPAPAAPPLDPETQADALPVLS